MPPAVPATRQAPQAPATMAGATLVAHMLALEAFVVALGAIAMPKEQAARDTWMTELKKDVAGRTNAQAAGHGVVAKESDGYADDLFNAMIAAATPIEPATKADRPPPPEPSVPFKMS